MNEGARARDPACVSLLRRLRMRRMDAAWLYTLGVLQALARAQTLRMGRNAVGGRPCVLHPGTPPLLRGRGGYFITQKIIHPGSLLSTK